MDEKRLNLTPQQKMTLWAVWDYAKSRRRADGDGADDAAGPVITKKAVGGRFLDRFEQKFKERERELDALAGKRVLRADPDAGDGCFRVADRAAAEAVYREVEGDAENGDDVYADE